MKNFIITVLAILLAAASPIEVQAPVVTVTPIPEEEVWSTEVGVFEYYFPTDVIYCDDDVSETYLYPEESADSIDYSKYFSEADIYDLSCVLYGEVRGGVSDIQRECVAWVVLNRVDAWEQSIHQVVWTRNQFAPSRGSDEAAWARANELARDVLTRWAMEKEYGVSVGRVLPTDYLYFHGGYHGERIIFGTEYPIKNPYDYYLTNYYES